MSVETVAKAMLEHGGAWTEDDYFALGETLARIELVDGVLVVSPLADGRHQAVVGELTRTWLNTCPDRAMGVFPGLNVRLWPGNIRIPDVVIARRAQSRGVRTAASAVLLVTEVTSPGNFRQDRIAKHGEYAEAGIPFYLRVDLHLGVEELTATLFELVDGEYVARVHATDGVLRLERPWPLEIDLRAAARG
jgi:Uma2 family endonuclease